MQGGEPILSLASLVQAQMHSFGNPVVKCRMQSPVTVKPDALGHRLESIGLGSELSVQPILLEVSVLTGLLDEAVHLS